MFSISGLWISPGLRIGLRPLTWVKRHLLLRPEVPGTIASVFSWCMGQKNLELMGVISCCSGRDEALQASGGDGETVGIPHFNFAPTECVGSEVFLRLISPIFPISPFDFCFLLWLPLSFILFLPFHLSPPLFYSLNLFLILFLLFSLLHLYSCCEHYVCFGGACAVVYGSILWPIHIQLHKSIPRMKSLLSNGSLPTIFSVFSFPPFCNLGEQVSEMPEVTHHQIKAVTQTQVWLTLIPHLFSVHIDSRLKFISFSA